MGVILFAVHKSFVIKMYNFICWYRKTKTHHTMSSSNHSTTATNTSRHLFKVGRGGYRPERVITYFLTSSVAVHPSIVSENYFSSVVLIIFTKVQTVCVLVLFC